MKVEGSTAHPKHSMVTQSIKQQRIATPIKTFPGICLAYANVAYVCSGICLAYANLAYVCEVHVLAYIGICQAYANQCLAYANLAYVCIGICPAYAT